MKDVIVIGKHVIAQSIVSQYEALGCHVDVSPDFEGVRDISKYGELCVLPDASVSDETTLNALESLANRYPIVETKPLCHLLLHNKVTLWLMQTLNIYQDINRKFEIYAFTMEDQWAKNVLCHLDNNFAYYPALDHERIDVQSNKTVHIVIAGFSDLGESLAIHTALTAHYPNYVRNNSLRTRITMIGEHVIEKIDSFIHRYYNLFENSYYRIIHVDNRKILKFHEPIYNSSREDFIDVEWEFVESDFYDPVIQQKLMVWSEDKNSILTLALCEDSAEENFQHAFSMPKPIYLNDIPVFINVKNATLLDEVRTTNSYKNLYPIGMDDCGYDVSLPLLQMAKRLNYFYVCSYSEKGVPTDMPVDDIEKEWSKIESFSIRYSNIYNVMTVATKMRSLGHEEEEWNNFYALTQDEVELLSAVEHNRWCVDRLVLGFRPPTNSEREAIKNNIREFIAAKKTGGDKPAEDLKKVFKAKKIHYDLCSYKELDVDKTGRNVRVYDYDLTAGIPLIAQSFKEKKS